MMGLWMVMLCVKHFDPTNPLWIIGYGGRVDFELWTTTATITTIITTSITTATVITTATITTSISAVITTCNTFIAASRNKFFVSCVKYLISWNAYIPSL